MHQKADAADKCPTKFLGKPDENSFGSTDVTEPVYVLIVDHFTYELRAARADPFQSAIDSRVSSMSSMANIARR